MYYSLTIIHITTILITLLLGACAAAPDYVPADDASDYGHYSTRLGEDRYRVVFNGKRSTSLETTRNYAMLRAAELTLAEGNDWFQVVDRETTSLQSSDPAAAFRYERANFVERNCGVLSCTQSVRPAYSAGVGIDNRSPETRYSHALEIVMGKGPMPAGGACYDADELTHSLWASM